MSQTRVSHPLLSEDAFAEYIPPVKSQESAERALKRLYPIKYELVLMSSEIKPEKGKLYLSKIATGFEYSVLDAKETLVKGIITEAELGQKIKEPLLDELKPLLGNILEIIAKRDHLECQTILSDYVKNTEIKPAENEKQEQKIEREQQQKMLEKKQAAFKAQFFELMDVYTRWGKKYNLENAVRAIEGLRNSIFAPM